jgi:hypothetical protein
MPCREYTVLSCFFLFFIVDCLVTMNLLQLQENFQGACLKYASDVKEVEDPDLLFKAEYIPNPDYTGPSDPQNIVSITEWNHESTQPTNTDLMLISISDAQAVLENYTSLPRTMIATRVPRVSETDKKRAVKRKFEDGDMIYNTSNKRVEVFDGTDWVQNIVTRDEKGNMIATSATVSSLAVNSKAIFVSSVSDLPAAVDGVITLTDNVCYTLAGSLDLAGARLVGGRNITLNGNNGSSTILTSTGLDASTPLFTSIYQCNFRDITIANVGTAISLTSSTASYDWAGVRFVNVPTVGTVTGCALFGFGRGGLVLSKGLTFQGSCASIAFLNCAFQSNGTAGSMITLGSTFILANRFRIVDSGFWMAGVGTGITVDPSAVINTEAFMLDSVVFSGSGTYLNGITHSNSQALFLQCAGITNSFASGVLLMADNATATTISNTNDFVKVVGTTTAGSNNAKYAATDNRLTNATPVSRKYLVQACVSFTGTANDIIQFGLYDSTASTVRDSSKRKATIGSSGRVENICLHTVVDHSVGNYVEVWVRNITQVADVTVTDLNLTVTQL